MNFQEPIQLFARTLYHQEQKETVGRQNSNTVHQIFFGVCRIWTGGEIPLSNLTCFMKCCFLSIKTLEKIFTPTYSPHSLSIKTPVEIFPLPSITMILSHGQIILPSTAKCKSEKFLHFSLEILQNAFW